MSHTTPFRAPRRPAALAALPSGREVALYDETTRSVHTYATACGMLGETTQLHSKEHAVFPGAQTIDTAAPGPFYDWKMASNAAVVVGVDDEAGVWVIRPQKKPLRMYKEVKITQLVAVDRLGLWALVQVRFELALLSLQNETLPKRWLGSTGDVQVTDQATRYVVSLCTSDKGMPRVVLERSHSQDEAPRVARARLVAPAGAGVPLYVHLSGDAETDTFYVVYGALEKGAASNKNTHRITLQKWQVHWATKPTLHATQAMHFPDPFDDFVTLPGTGQMACKWPQRGGYVLQKGRGDTPFTSRVRPVGTRSLTLWVPHDMPDTIHAMGVQTL